jgi:cytochrome bd ubiquinol oxidase subunit II
MTLATFVAAVLFAGILAYAIFGGADFGTGFWDLLAGNDERGGPQRTLIDQSLGPVWEANHVWLVFVLVFLWTGFPRAFAAISTTLVLPLAGAALGIVARGSGFALRKFSETLPTARFFGAMFALSSIVTPFFFGTVVGAIASGRVHADGTSDRWTSWTGPVSILGGVLAVLTCAYLAGVFLAADAHRTEQVALAEHLRRRVSVVGIVTGAVVLGGAIVLRSGASGIYQRLSGRGVVFVVLSGAAGVMSLGLLVRRRYRLARIATTVAVGAVVAGWGFAQYPYVLFGQVTIDSAAGARAVLIGLTVVAALLLVIVIPSLAWLFRLVNQD